MDVSRAPSASHRSPRQAPAMARAGRPHLRLALLVALALVLVCPSLIVAAPPSPDMSVSPQRCSVQTQDCGAADGSAPSDWPVAVCDNFDADSGDWLTGIDADHLAITSRFIGGGTYTWQVEALQGVFTSAPYDDAFYSDFYVAADGLRVGGASEARYALLFRWQDGANFYAFVVDDSTQYFAVQAAYEDRWETLLDWTYSDAIRPGETNRLSVLGQGPRFLLFVNGQQVGEVSDNRIPDGQVGLAVSLDEDRELTIQFDDFEVRVPPSGTATEEAGPAPLPTGETGTAVPTPASSCTHGEWLVEHGWTRVVCDPFSDNANDWPSGAYSDEYAQIVRTIADGAYHWELDALQSVTAWTTLPDQDFTDFYASVEVRKLSGPDESIYGLVFRQVDDDNFYRFGLSESQGVILDVLLADQWHNLINWSPSSAIRQGDWNQLAVSTTGPSFTFYVNDQEVATFDDWRLTRGGLGLAVEGTPGQHLDVVFDNFEVVVPTSTLRTDVTPGPTVPPIVTLSPAECERPPSAPVDWTEALCDQFLDNRMSWLLGIKEDDYARVERIMAAATYGWDIEAYKDMLTWVTYADQEFTDFYATTKGMRFVGPPDFSYGLMFRWQEPGDYYLFQVGDGWFEVGLYSDGVWQDLIDATSSDAVNVDDWNRLSVKAEGSHFTFYVNGLQVAEVDDTRLDRGLIGLSAALNAGGHLNVQFTDLLVLVPPGGATVTPAPPQPQPPTPIPVSDACLTASTGPADWRVLTCDGFVDNGADWPTAPFEGELGELRHEIEGGAYLWNTKADSDVVYSGRSGSSPDLGDFHAAVQAGREGGPDDAEYGLQFRRVDSDTWAMFLANDAGEFRIKVIQDGEWNELIKDTADDAIRPGQANWMSILARGPAVSFYINGQQVAQFGDFPIAEGQVGLAVALSEGEESAIRFDNFEIRIPPSSGDEVVPAPTAAPTIETGTLPQQWQCWVCQYVYDPVHGDPSQDVPPGTSFEDLPEDWVCPQCGAEKELFESVDNLYRSNQRY